ncbi:DUF7715 family protein [Mycobacterium intracellulare]|uniref:DUF7715 family protein n=2 Tax=Mycobacterium intracellulare TaxID=1767 RepID=UPI003B21DA9B
MSPCTRTDCGCDRAHIGLSSCAGSTTVMVRDVPLTLHEMVTACSGYFETAWGAAPLKAADLASAVIGAAVDAATYHKSGTVLRPWFDHTAREWRYRVASGVS